MYDEHEGEPDYGVATMAKKATPKPDVNLQAKDLEAKKHIKVLEGMYPNRPTFKRKIIHLWDNNYRVNFHDKLNGNFIKYSYFVSIPLPAPVPKSTCA